jgi:hypothetical protein
MTKEAERLYDKLISKLSDVGVPAGGINFYAPIHGNITAVSGGTAHVTGSDTLAEIHSLMNCPSRYTTSSLQ